MNNFSAMESRTNSSVMMKWLLATSRIHWIGSSPLPNSHCVVVCNDPWRPVAAALLSNVSSADHSHLIVGIPSEHTAAVDSMRFALQQARSARVSVVPLGVVASSQFPFLGGQQFPLPRAHIVACVETPFNVPDRPETIAIEWINAVIQQLKQANGRAFDQVSTLRRAGSTA